MAAPTYPASAESVRLGADAAFEERALLAERASRGSTRRTAGVRPAVTRKLRTPRRPMTVVIERASLAADRAVAGHAAATEVRATGRALVANREPAHARARPTTRVVRYRARRVRPARAAVRRHTVVTRPRSVIRRQRVGPSRGGMTAVIAFARSQVGKRYVSGGVGGSGFDCSGLTMQAYQRAGIRLPHSSTAQAGQARSISRAQARAGDLVIGPGHVGIYMGNGMMIDAGNHRTGVVYRKLYSGLRVARLHN